MIYMYDSLHFWSEVAVRRGRKEEYADWMFNNISNYQKTQFAGVIDVNSCYPECRSDTAYQEFEEEESPEKRKEYTLNKLGDEE